MDSAIYRFKGFRIALFYGDHPPPHVHLLGPGVKLPASRELARELHRVDMRR